MATKQSKTETNLPVPIFRCRDKACKAFIREELAGSSSPTCPICNGPMIRSMKHLPGLVTKYKNPPKNVSG